MEEKTADLASHDLRVMVGLKLFRPPPYFAVEFPEGIPELVISKVLEPEDPFHTGSKINEKDAVAISSGRYAIAVTNVEADGVSCCPLSPASAAPFTTGDVDVVANGLGAFMQFIDFTVAQNCLELFVVEMPISHVSMDINVSVV